MISIIVGVSNNNVIGLNNTLPWYLPADLANFKRLTIGKTVIMGRKTSDSILSRLNHPLADRRNVVITRDKSYHPGGMEVFNSLNQALLIKDSELVIIGGEQIYRQTIEIADRMYITEVHADIRGDTFFPVIDPSIWKEVSRNSHVKDDHNQYDYDFVEYHRII